MTSAAASSSLTNTSVFEFDEIETNKELRLFVYGSYDINDLITQDRLSVDDVKDQDDAFRTRLQAIDPKLVKMYADRNVAGFFWLRLPQPSKGTADPRILSLELQWLMQILEEVSRIFHNDQRRNFSSWNRDLAHAFHGCQLDDALSIR